MMRDEEARPPRPSEILSQHFASFTDLNQSDLAKALDMSRLTANELLNGHRAITAVMALKLARLFGTDAEFWLNLQVNWDLARARREHQAEVDRLLPLREFIADGQVARRTRRADLRRLAATADAD